MNIEQITERFASQGYQGKELMKAVYMYAYGASLMSGNQEAADHFSAQYEAL